MAAAWFRMLVAYRAIFERLNSFVHVRGRFEAYDGRLGNESALSSENVGLFPDLFSSCAMNFPAVIVFSVADSGIEPPDEPISEALDVSSDSMSETPSAFIPHDLRAYFQSEPPSFATSRLKFSFMLRFTPESADSSIFCPVTIDFARLPAFDKLIPPSVRDFVISETDGSTSLGFEIFRFGLNTGTSKFFVNGRFSDEMSGRFPSATFPFTVNGSVLLSLYVFAKLIIESYGILKSNALDFDLFAEIETPSFALIDVSLELLHETSAATFESEIPIGYGFLTE